ncbi:MAG: carboxypeptidase regulatory-like domain-containing protein [Candidatus Brocadiaceae bacterium]
MHLLSPGKNKPMSYNFLKSRKMIFFLSLFILVLLYAGVFLAHANARQCMKRIGKYYKEFTLDGCVSGTTAYLGFNNSLLILDVSNPKKPKLVGSLDIRVSEIYVSDKTAYVLNYEGLHTIDVSDPTKPEVLGRYYTAFLSNIFVSDKTAYVTDNDGDFRIFDVSNPKNPKLQGILADALVNTQDVEDIYVYGTRAYVAFSGSWNWDGGLLIIDISKPTSPKLISKYLVDGDLFGVFVSGTTAYVAGAIDSSKYLLTIDVSNPSNPKLLGHADSYNLCFGRGLYISGTTAYVLASCGLHIFDVSNPASPKLIWKYPVGGDWIFVSGSIIYIIGENGLDIICLCDCSDDTGGISGTVTDDSDEPLAGKKVLLKRTVPSHPVFKKTANTNGNGKYNFSKLSNGTYKIKVVNCKKGGTKTVEITENDQVNDINFTCVPPTASYEWTFDSSDLSAAIGNGVMEYADGATPGLTSFGTTDGSTVPHIDGQPAAYMRVPAFTGKSNGYYLTFTDSGPNGGGKYINQYTWIADVLIPGNLNWTPMYNTHPENTNESEFYIGPSGQLWGYGIGESAAGIVAANTWFRVAFVANLNAGVIDYYCNGKNVHHGTGTSMHDKQFSLYSNTSPYPGMLLFNEGNTNGVYTHELYVNSIAFIDRTMTEEEIAALGGPKADGIFKQP